LGAPKFKIGHVTANTSIEGQFVFLETLYG